MLRFIDVSNWQGAVSWPALGDGALDGAIIKLSEDTWGIDRFAVDNIAGAASSGLLVGGYHYAHPEQASPDQSVQTVITAIEAVGGRRRNIVPFLDMEAGFGRLDRWCAEWGDLFWRHYGVRAGFYSGPWFMGPHRLDIEGVAEQFSCLWLADWDGEPTTIAPRVAGWPAAAIRQYGTRAYPPALPSPVDSNVYYGTRDEWSAMGLRGAN